AIGLFEEGPAVGDVGGHPGVGVGLVGVGGAAELAQLGVDLHGVDVLGALGQRDGDVGAAARADDEHVVGLGGGPLVGQPVLGLPLQAGVGGHGLLVRDAVDGDVGDGHAEPRELAVGDLGVGRPER